LRSLIKVEDRALPIPYVVYEAIYTPQPNTAYPNYTPAETRMRFGAPGQYEFSLYDHLKAQSSVSCQLPTAQGTCIPENVVASVVPFDQEHAASTATPAPRATGCAAIEATSEQDRLKDAHAQAPSMPERFQFDADSSSLSPDATDAANKVAKRLLADPSLECLAVVGQITNGESPSLAEARAHAIKELLISMGVERSRLLTIAVTANVYGSGSKPQDPEPKDRRVSLSILLQTHATPGASSPAPAPAPAPAAAPAPSVAPAPAPSAAPAP